MTSGTRATGGRSLSLVVQKLGPINRPSRDTWLGKRGHRREDFVQPVRLRKLSKSGQPSSPAFTARSRDISANGLGLTVPEPFDMHQPFQVEIFTEADTWLGHMRLVHCTQTVGAYKVGLVCTGSDGLPLDLPAENIEATRSSSETAHADPGQVLTLDQALDEVRQAVRRYALAELSWGLMGKPMQKELERILEGFPTPAPSRARLEPRRSAYRHDVEGSVHTLLAAPGGCELVTTDIADISAGGLRLVLSPHASAREVGVRSRAWQAGVFAAVGIWVPDSGTLWLPTRVVHGSSPLFKEESVGLQFVRGNDFPELE